MSKASDPYSRVYWRIVDDDRFAAIYGNDHHLSAWLRLLLIADQAWPASANLPASVRPLSLAALSDCGLIEVRPGGLYRVHGLDAERERRSSVGIPGASARWSDGNANASPTHTDRTANAMPDETRRDELRQDEDEQDPPWLRAWLQVRMLMPTPRQREVIESYLRTFDETGPERAASVFLHHSDDPLGALIADLRAFRETAKGEAVQAETEAKQRRKVERRGFRPGTVEYELAQMLTAKGEAK